MPNETPTPIESGELQTTAKYEHAIKSHKFDELPKIPVRKPVFEKEDDLSLTTKPKGRNLLEYYYSETLNMEAPAMKTWHYVLEAANKELTQDPLLAEKVSELTNEEVSQELLRKFIKIIADQNEDNLPSRLIERYRVAQLDTTSELSRLINESDIPEELIEHSIYTTPKYENPNNVVAKYIQDIEQGSSNTQDIMEKALTRYYTEFEQFITNKVKFARGLTKEEKIILGARYRMAREVKMLAIKAHLATSENTRILNTVEAAKDIDLEGLLNIENWGKPKYLKDRVYELEILDKEGNPQKIIIKQQKTQRHMDYPQKGHFYPQESKKEVEVAEKLYNTHTRANEVEISFEKPIGQIETEDGFQLAVFEHAEKEFLTKQEALEHMQNKILQQRDKYEEEYKRISARVQELLVDPTDIVNRNLKSNVNSAPPKTRSKQELSFEEFAVAKAYETLNMAAYLRYRELIKHNLESRDSYDYEFAESTDDNCLINLVGIDFEMTFETAELSIEEKRKKLVELRNIHLRHAGEKNSLGGSISRQCAMYAICEKSIYPTL